MTRQEAQKRNLSIMQFRGMYNRINKLIPDDIRDELSNYQIEILEKAAIIYSEINEIMNKKAKHKHLFTRKDINGRTICFSCEKIKYTREKK